MSSSANISSMTREIGTSGKRRRRQLLTRFDKGRVERCNALKEKATHEMDKERRWEINYFGS